MNHHSAHTRPAAAPLRGRGLCAHLLLSLRLSGLLLR